MAAQQATIYAVMQDGTLIVEFVVGFLPFIDLVLAFRNDPDCIHLSWVVGGDRSVEQAYACNRVEVAVIHDIIARASAALSEIVDPAYRESLAAFIARRRVQVAAMELAERLRDQHSHDRDMAAQVDPTWWAPLESADEARQYGLAIA